MKMANNEHIAVTPSGIAATILLNVEYVDMYIMPIPF